MCVKQRLALIVVCLVICFNSYAQKPSLDDFHLTHYTDENGLPQNSVKAIVKDKNGFLWMGTEGGLVRFDGQHFFTFDKTNLPISGNRIHGFIPSLKTYSIRNQEFTAITEQLDYIKIRKNGNVVIEKDFKNHHIANSPLGKQIKGGIFIMRTLPSIDPIKAGHEPFFYPAGDKKYFVWHDKKIDYFLENRLQASVNGRFKEFILIDSEPFAIMENGGFVKINFSKKSEEIKLSGDILYDPKFKLTEENHTIFWNNISQKAFIYFNECFYSIKLSVQGKYLTTKLIIKGINFAKLSIQTVHYNEEENQLYLGSNIKGLFILKRKNFITKKNDDTGTDNIFYAQIPFSKHSIITAQGEVFNYGPGVQEHRPTLLSLNKDLESKFFMAGNTDSTFWVGISHTLNKYNSSGTKIIKSYQFKGRVKSLYKENDKKLWIGSEKDSLYTLNTAKAGAVPELELKGQFGEISCMIHLPGNVLMIGTKTGLYRYEAERKKLFTVKELERSNIRSFYNSGGRLWITTYGDGIFMLSGNKLHRLPLDANKYLATSHCIIEDQKGYFWITTNKGLFQASKMDLINYSDKKQQSVFYLYYDKRHGFSSNEFNGGCQPCALRLSNRLISLPSIDGFIWFNPEKLKLELPDKNLFISTITLDGKLLEPTGLKHIPRDFKQLNISISTPYFDHPNNVQIDYTFQKAGQKPAWIPVSYDFTIPIPNTSSGNHILILRKKNGFGKDNFTEKILNIYIEPAWYETWIFQIVFFVLIIIVLWYITRIRTAYLVNEEKKKSLYRRYHISSQIVAAINHDIQTPLHYISHSVSKIQELLLKDHSENEFISKLSKETVNTVNRTRAHTLNLLNYIKSQNRDDHQKLIFGPVEVYNLVNHTCVLLSGAADYRGVLIQNLIKKDFVVSTDCKLFSIIIHNLMDNAVKLSESTISISSESYTDQQHLVITDTANGMPEELCSWINKKYKSYDDWMRDYSFPGHKGLGLIIVKDLCILLKIKIEVKTIAGSGTSITLVLKN